MKEKETDRYSQQMKKQQQFHFNTLQYKTIEINLTIFLETPISVRACIWEQHVERFSMGHLDKRYATQLRFNKSQCSRCVTTAFNGSVFTA